jgi:hypothetical protein
VADKEKAIFWHRDLPPIDAEPLGEYVLEATSTRIKMGAAHRDELWGRCHGDLMAHVSERLGQEMERLGGDCAHVLEEVIDSRHDDVAGETWLYGRFRYVLLRRPSAT